ncbi:MAG: hypothetical protein IPL46_04380 [Saprospiraceae bacterium]|nr:hypothetical protein [Saprospiraceae bacterium]
MKFSEEYGWGNKSNNNGSYLSDKQELKIILRYKWSSIVMSPLPFNRWG